MLKKIHMYKFKNIYEHFCYFRADFLTFAVEFSKIFRLIVIPFIIILSFLVFWYQFDIIFYLSPTTSLVASSRLAVVGREKRGEREKKSGRTKVFFSRSFSFVLYYREPGSGYHPRYTETRDRAYVFSFLRSFEGIFRNGLVYRHLRNLELILPEPTRRFIMRPLTVSLSVQFQFIYLPTFAASTVVIVRLTYKLLVLLVI